MTGSHTVIGSMIETDRTALAALDAAAWLEAYRGVISGVTLDRMVAARRARWLTAPPSPATRVLRLGNVPQGFASFGPNRSRYTQAGGELYELYVAPEAQGMGIGGLLLDEARAGIAAAGMRGMVVWSLASNSRALSFYESRGGRKIAGGMEHLGGSALPTVAFYWP